MKTNRENTRRVWVGKVPVGGGAPVSVQTMLTEDPHDVAALTAGVARCAEAGADIVRLTVPDMRAAEVLRKVVAASPIPLVADIHFDWRLALAAIDAGVQALRLNPGNIGGAENVRAVAQSAAAHHIPIRIGVNGGSLESALRVRYGGATPEALVESALGHLKLLEDVGFRDAVISVKASDVPRTLAAYRLLAERTDCPLHVGVTEAGTLIPGTVRNAVALGILLSEGIGDTIRVSLTDHPEREVKVGLEILRSVGLRAPGPCVTSCPTCGRTQCDLLGTAERVEAALEAVYRTYPADKPFPHVAVMGCVVNGPGEAKGADIALCGGKDEFLLYIKGELKGRVRPEEAVSAVLENIARY